MMKRILAAALTAALILAAVPLCAVAETENTEDRPVEETLDELNLEEDFEAAPVVAMMKDSLSAKSAVLLDQATGKVLYEQNPDEQLPPASVTKVMTLLLVIEAL